MTEAEELMRKMGIDPDELGRTNNLTKPQEAGKRAMDQAKAMLDKYKTK